jgi:hypothetical protein
VRYGKRLVAVAATAGCVAAGALGGLANSSAASKSATTKSTTAAPAGMAGGHDRGVHSETVVLNRAGTAFETVVSDDGTLSAISGSTLTVREGTDSVTYKTVTISVPAAATVLRNGQTAKLTDLKVGDHVRIAVADDGSSVMANDSSFAPQGHGHGGHGDTPPTGAPPAAG